MTSTVPCCVLTDVQEKETLTPFTSFTLAVFPAAVTKSSHSKPGRVFKLPGSEENISAREDASTLTPVNFSRSTSGAEADVRLEGTEEITWEAGTHRQAHRSRFRCLNLWHGHLVGFTFSPGNKVVGKLVKTPPKAQRLGASEPKASLSTRHKSAD